MSRLDTRYCFDAATDALPFLLRGVPRVERGIPLALQSLDVAAALVQRPFGVEERLVFTSVESM